MLFSATQTTKVEDLARVSLKKAPLYINVEEHRPTATVEGLEQGYVVCPSERRFLLLFTFLKKNMKKKKIIVFFSSCNSVKFHAELLNYIDIPVMDLHVWLDFTFIYFSLTFYSRVDKSSKNARAPFSSFATQSRASSCARTWPHVVSTSLPLTGSFSTTPRTILASTFTVSAVQRVPEARVVRSSSFSRPSSAFSGTSSRPRSL